MTDRAPRVFVVILNWNAFQDTIHCLDSVLAVEYPSYEVVVVDNGSTDPSVEEIRRWLEARGARYSSLSAAEVSERASPEGQKSGPAFSHRSVTLIETGRNLGYTGGNNVGIRYAMQRGADYVLLLNEDTKVSPDFLTKMVATAEREPRVGLVGGKIRSMDDPTHIQYQGGNLNYWIGIYGSFGKKGEPERYGEMDVNFIPGCAVLMKRGLLEQVGLLEEDYFLYADDVEFPYRALQSGWQVKVNLDAVIFHRAVPGRGQRALSYYYYGTRNLLYFITKYLRGIQKVSCLLFFLGGRVLLMVGWLVRGRSEYLQATYLGFLDYLRGVTGPKGSRLARHDERVRIGAEP